MEKSVIVLLLCSATLQERSPKQLFLSAFNPHVYTHNSQNPLYSQQFQYLGISPQISPLYSFWTNLGTLSYNAPQPLHLRVDHQSPTLQWTSQQHLSTSLQHHPNAPLQQIFTQNGVIAFPQTSAPTPSTPSPQNHHISKLDQNIQQNKATFSSFGAYSSSPSVKAFQRGQVESRPQEVHENTFYDFGNDKESGGGFVRGHVESKPGELLANWKSGERNIGHERSSALSFDRGAVEFNNHQQTPQSSSNNENQFTASGYQASAPKVVCYFASWAWYRKGRGSFVPEHIDASLCTHVIYAFALLDKTKMAIKMSDPWTDDKNNFYKRIVALKEKNENLKVLLAVGGWSDSGDDKYSVLAHSPESRAKFASQSKEFLKSRGFDGLSLDWHYPKCWQSNCELGPASDRTAFSDLIRELKNVFEPAGLLVSATLSGYKEVIDLAYDVPMLSRSLDLMNIMAYDYHGAWESRTGHVAPLYMGNPAADPSPHYNANFTMNYYASLGADRSKLVLGVPMYGQSFQLENEGDAMVGSRSKGPGNPGEYTNQPGMLAYYEICKRVKNAGWQVVKDLTGSWGPYAHLRDQWVGFDDSDSVVRKSRFVKAQNFGGVFVWTLDLDDFQNECCRGTQPLLRSIAKEILSIPYDANQEDCSQRPPVVTPAPSTGTSTVSDNNTPWVPPGQAFSTPKPTESTTSATNGPSTTDVVQPTPSSTPTSMIPGETCDNAWSFKPDSSDCSSYYQCVSGKVIQQRCPYGLHWNQFARACDWPQSARCVDIPSSSTTTTTTEPWWQSSSTTTSQYSTSTLDPPPQTQPTTSTRIPYRECVPGEYYAAPNCDQYYLCNNGLKKLQSCGPGLHWDQRRKLCDWPQAAMCQQGVRMEDDKQTGQQCQEGSYTASKEDCEVYLVCVHGRYSQFRCQSGLHWNTESKVCDWPQNAGCTVSNSPPPSVTTEMSPQPQPVTDSPSSTTMQSTTLAQRPQVVSSTPSPTPTTSNPSEMVTSEDITSKDFMIVCYFTNWAWYRQGTGKFKPENIDPNLCTHVVYGFAVLDSSELIIKPHDTWADYDNKFYEQVTALRSRGTKVSIAIGGWNDSLGDKYSRLVNNPSARRKFIQNVIEFIKKNNFDGLDLDWEYPKCWQVECDKGPVSDKPSFAAFVRELKEAFEPHGLFLSAAVSPSKSVIELAYQVPTLSRYLDWIAVMTYDYHGQWDKKTGHVSPLFFHEEDDFFYFNTNYTINYWIAQGADRRKLVMGMPLYGQSFTLANPSQNGLNAPSSGAGAAGQYTQAAGFLAYYEICTHVKRDGWTVVEDGSGAIGPYAYKGNQWVSYDDVAMIKKKSQLVRDLDIGGAMVWALDLDDFNNNCGQGRYPLLTTINNVLSKPRDGIRKIVLRPSSKSPQPQTTTLPTITEPEESLDPCFGEPFRPHFKDCRRYFQCLYGRYHEHKCPGGTFWNQDHCDWTCGLTVASTGSNNTAPAPVTLSPSTTRTTQRSSSPMTAAPTSLATVSAGQGTTKDWGWKPALVTTTTVNPVHVRDTEYKIVCYFTNWAWYRPGLGKYKPEDIDYNLCTHIAYGFAVLNPTTLEIKTHDSWADIDNTFYTQVANLRSKGKKVVIAIGGWNDSAGDKYSKLVNDATARAKFISTVIDFIEKWGFDGLDLDWEYPTCWQTDCSKGPVSDKSNFGALVRELSEAFKPKGLLLSSAVSPSKVIIDKGYDVPLVSKYLDWIAVMTYDYHGQWDKKTGHVAPLYHHEESDNFYFNTNYTINYWISQGADRKKIVMGMPMYGQSFSLADTQQNKLNTKSYGGGEAGEFTRAQGFLAYYEICSYVQKKGWTVVQDSSGAVGPYAYKGNQWVSFDDVKMIRRKSEYIKDMGLGGGMIWALDLDDFRGSCGCEKHPLLKTINRVLRSYPEPDPNCNL